MISSRKWVLPFIAVFLAGAAIGSVAVGALYPRVDSTAIDNATREIVVTAPITQQSVREVYSLSAQVSLPSIVDVQPLAPVALGRQVVSGGIRASGDVVRYADLLGEVSGRPVFAMPASVPLYRDLVAGAEGNDVAAVQHMLVAAGLYAGPADGKLGSSTLAALAEMYARAGYSLPELAPEARGIPLSEVALIPGDSLAVFTAAELGSEISEATPLLRLLAAPPVIVARVDLLQAEAFAAGTGVSVQIGSNAPFDSAVASVSDYQAAEASLPAGYDITISIPPDIDVSDAESAPVVVAEKAEPPVGSAVPLPAIRRDANGSTFVLVASTASEKQPAAWSAESS